MTNSLDLSSNRETKVLQEGIALPDPMTPSFFLYDPILSLLD